jgi:hypothetical protein
MSTETATYCAKHPKEETVVSCASCGTPICTRCMVATPVGMKCRNCASNRNSVLYQVRPERFALAVIVSVAAGFGAGLLGHIGFFAIFLGTAYGYFAGSVILKASGMKRGLKLEIGTGVGMALGAIGCKLAPILLTHSLWLKAGATGMPLALTLLADPFFLIGSAIAIGCAVSKIRYL